MIAWIPMLPDDDRAAAQDASALLAAAGAPQYWDADQKLGAEVAHSLDADGWTAWDIYLFYPPGVRWDDHLPAPTAALAQVKSVVVGTKGTLPPDGDQDALPERLRARADVVGRQADITALLQRAATRFGELSRTSPSNQVR
jgi:hypothetical protein